MSIKWYPVIDYGSCIDCGTCVHKCHHGVYAPDSNHPRVVHPEVCIEGCHGCQRLCPTDSITYVGEGTIADAICVCGCDEERKCAS